MCRAARQRQNRAALWEQVLTNGSASIIAGLGTPLEEVEAVEAVEAWRRCLPSTTWPFA